MGETDSISGTRGKGSRVEYYLTEVYKHIRYWGGGRCKICLCRINSSEVRLCWGIESE